MITLISGALGTGKTALAIKLLTESEFYPSSAFVYGVRGWKGAGTFYDLKVQEHAKDNQKLLEDTGRVTHSCYLVDEAKKVWPSRVAGRDAPPFIDQHLAESRSVSQDWILTCQAPTQIDVALRRLVGRHIHLERTPFGIRYSESGSIRDDLKFSRDESRKYDFPVKSLELYQSDEGVTSHQKKGLRLPKRLIFLLGLITVLFGTIGYFWNQSTIFGGMAKKGEGSGASSFMASSKIMGDSKSAAPEVLPVTAAPHQFYYKPRNPEYPELARAPRFPVSCVASSRKCVCYDQATQLIDDLSEKRCREIASGRNPMASLYPSGGSNAPFDLSAQREKIKALEREDESSLPQKAIIPTPSLEKPIGSMPPSGSA